MTAINLLLILAIIPAIGFPIVYALTARWYGTQLGRSLMWMGVSIAAILSLALATSFLGPDFPGRQVVRLIVFSLVASSMWPLFITYIVTVHKVRRKKINGETNDDG